MLAGDVLDQRGMVTYLKRYERHLDGEPEIWGLHNYADTNRFRDSGLKDLLATVPGDVWLTETGGIVQFGRSFPRDERRAARAVRYALKLARDNERVKRIYLYNWTGGDRKARFDAGLIASDGTARPAYDALREALDERTGLSAAARFAPASRRATRSSRRSSSRPRPTASSSAAHSSTSARPSRQRSSVSRRPASPESRRLMIASRRAVAAS